MTRSSSLLIHESPLQVLPRLAAEIGLGDAIVLQQLHYLVGHPQSGGWVALTTREWIAEHLPFYSRSTLQRIFDRLHESGLIVIEDLGRTGADGGIRARIQIDYDVLDRVAERLEEQERARQNFAQNEARPSVKMRPGLASKRRQALGQSDARPGVNLTLGSDPLKAEGKEEREPAPPASISNRTPRQRQIDEVIAAWAEATGRQRPDEPTDAQTAIVGRAIDAHSVADCVDAVKGWRYSPWHNGDKDGTTRNILAALLHAEQIEELRDLQRRHAAGGNVAGRRAARPATIADIQAAQKRRGQGAA